MTDKEQKIVEVARSFSRKLNTGNYETVDFFCSQKIECLEKEAGEKSKELHLWCKTEVEMAVAEYQNQLKGTTKVDFDKAVEQGEKFREEFKGETETARKKKVDTEVVNSELQEAEEKEKFEERTAGIPVVNEPEYTGEQSAEDSFRSKYNQLS